jgi:hypothetical protein
MTAPVWECQVVNPGFNVNTRLGNSFFANRTKNSFTLRMLHRTRNFAMPALDTEFRPDKNRLHGSFLRYVPPRSRHGLWRFWLMWVLLTHSIRAFVQGRVINNEILPWKPAPDIFLGTKKSEAVIIKEMSLVYPGWTGG